MLRPWRREVRRAPVKHNGTNLARACGMYIYIYGVSEVKVYVGALGFLGFKVVFGEGLR